MLWSVSRWSIPGEIFRLTSGGMPSCFLLSRHHPPCSILHSQTQLVWLPFNCNHKDYVHHELQIYCFNFKIFAFRCHVNTSPWMQWRNGLFVSVVETICVYIEPVYWVAYYLCVLFQSVLSCATRHWIAMQQHCLCGSWLCRALPASVCSGMKCSTSTKPQRISLSTSEGKRMESSKCSLTGCCLVKNQ